jgi:hypothetical protein
VALICVGCTTQWSKPGATRADFERDHRECEASGSLVPKVVLQSSFEDCMKARGYQMK